MAIDEPPASGEARPQFAGQAGVALGAAAGLAGTTAVFLLGLRPVAGEPRLLVTAAAGLGPVLSLIVAIGALASYRFFSASDIDAAAGGAPSAGARILQAIIQNTLEQAVLAIVVYGLLAMLLPARQLALPLAMAAAFVVGRIAFAIGYPFGGPGRALGFGLTFYPTAAGLALALTLIAARPLLLPN